MPNNRNNLKSLVLYKRLEVELDSQVLKMFLEPLHLNSRKEEPIWILNRLSSMLLCTNTLWADNSFWTHSLNAQRKATQTLEEWEVLKLSRKTSATSLLQPFQQIMLNSIKSCSKAQSQCKFCMTTTLLIILKKTCLDRLGIWSCSFLMINSISTLLMHRSTRKESLHTMQLRLCSLLKSEKNLSNLHAILPRIKLLCSRLQLHMKRILNS